VPWCKARFKGSEVLARCDDQGRLVAQEGRVEIRYRPGDARAYRAALQNLTASADGEVLPDATCVEAQPVAQRAGPGTRAGMVPTAAPDGAIVVYADGACSGNPGPAGVGIVLIDGSTRRELSQFLGEGTNNIAELSAIALAVEELGALDATKRPVRIYTDSQYAIGVLTKGWKAKANTQLVMRVRELLAGLSDVQLHYVRGHSGIPLNDRADALAVEAVQQRHSPGWVKV
jgi:ribonuclease HI